MAAPRDNMDEEMMDIINIGTQFADGDQQDVDVGSQYLALEDGTWRRVNGERTLFLSELETNITSVAMTLYMSSF